MPPNDSHVVEVDVKDFILDLSPFRGICLLHEKIGNLGQPLHVSGRLNAFGTVGPVPDQRTGRS